MSLSDSDYDELEEGIKLSLEERDEAVDKIVDNDSRIKGQFSVELQAIFEPGRPARTRRLSIKYKNK